VKIFWMLLLLVSMLAGCACEHHGWIRHYEWDYRFPCKVTTATGDDYNWVSIRCNDCDRDVGGFQDRPLEVKIYLHGPEFETNAIPEASATESPRRKLPNPTDTYAPWTGLDGTAPDRFRSDPDAGGH
jgi:hypothetical protein